MGNALFKTVTELTGLPEQEIEKELGKIVRDSGNSPESLTLDQLREAMLEYLQTVFVTEKVTDKNSKRFN